MAQTYRRDANDDNDFDERGVLKDGRRLRVPLMMMDGLDDVERAIVLDAAARRFGLSNGNDLRKPGYRYTTDSRALEAKERAYRERDEADAEAWRGNPPAGAGSGEFRGAQEGDICTVRGLDFLEDLGGPGHLQMRNGHLVCVPDKPQSARKHDHAMTMDEVYQAYDLEISQRWRTP